MKIKGSSEPENIKIGWQKKPSSINFSVSKPSLSFRSAFPFFVFLTFLFSSIEENGEQTNCSAYYLKSWGLFCFSPPSSPVNFFLHIFPTFIYEASFLFRFRFCCRFGCIFFEKAFCLLCYCKRRKVRNCGCEVQDYSNIMKLIFH